MADFIPVNEASLRAAIREPRYWSADHPERDGYNRWVTEGWQAFFRKGQGQNGLVYVRAYTRTRNGKTEQVAAHTRADPPGGDAKPGAGRPGATQGTAQVQLVQAQLLRSAPAIAQGAIRMAPAITRLWRAFPAGPRRNLLDHAVDGARRGSIAPRSWYNTIPEQEGEREAAAAAETEARSVPGPGATSAAPDAVEPERPRYTVHPGQQGKHQVGHNNHIPGRSEIDPDVDVQELVDRHALRGQPGNRIKTGEAGSTEFFDTGDRVIGIWRGERPGQSAPTTRGKIHYGSNGGVHVVPAPPRGPPTGGSR